MPPRNIQIYHYFGSNSFSPQLLAIQTPPFALGLITASLNCTLIYANLRGGRSTLNSTFNRLLVVLCVSDMTYELSQFVPIYLALSGRNFTDLLTCFYAQSHALIGAFWSVALMFLIAVDRLLGVVFPTKSFSNKSYQWALIVVSLPYPLFLWVLIWDYARANSTWWAWN